MKTKSFISMVMAVLLSITLFPTIPTVAASSTTFNSMQISNVVTVSDKLDFYSEDFIDFPSVEPHWDEGKTFYCEAPVTISVTSSTPKHYLEYSWVQGAAPTSDDADNNYVDSVLNDSMTLDNGVYLLSADFGDYSIPYFIIVGNATIPASLTELQEKITEADFQANSTCSPRTTTIETERSFSTNYEEPVLNYLVKNSDGSLTNVDCREYMGNIKVTTSNINGKTLWKKSIPVELFIFGSFYSGEKYNFMVFGSTTSVNKPNVEIFRIVKYDKKFKRLGSVSLTGSDTDTRSAFHAGSARFAENGNTLVLHTSREMFGGHQANLTITLDSNKMKVTDINFNSNQYVSHSFDQFVLFDQYDNKSFPVYLDLGDAAPRAVTIFQSTPEELELPFVEFVGGHSNYVFDIPGEFGNNYTGVKIGGFQASKGNYLTVINKDSSIILFVTPKLFTGDTKSKQIVIASDVYTNDFWILSNGDNTFTVVWHAISNTKSPLGYYDWHFTQVIDGDGNLIGKQKRYDDSYKFYTDFFNVSALPVSDVIAKLTPVKVPKELCKVVYYTQAENAYKSLINYTSATVTKGSKLKAPKAPTKKGYTLIGWYDYDSGKKWNFSTNKLNENILLVARFKKK